MKIIYCLLATILLCQISFSQTNKGNFHLSGSTNIGFSNIETTTIRYSYGGEDKEETNESNFNINPTIGYFIFNRLALGVSVIYEKTKENDFIKKNTLAGPYAIYYFTSSNIKPFLRADIAFGHQEEDNAGYNFKTDMKAYNFQGGVAIFPNKNLSFDLSLSYINYDGKTNAYIIDISKKGIVLAGGISIYL